MKVSSSWSIVNGEVMRIDREPKNLEILRRPGKCHWCGEEFYHNGVRGRRYCSKECLRQS